MMRLVPFLLVGVLASCEVSPKEQDSPATRKSPQGKGYSDRCDASRPSSDPNTTFLAVTGSKAGPFDAVAFVSFSSGETCSAVLVAPNQVVTAAHCFEDGNEPLSVEFESSGGQKHHVAIDEATIHPDYEKALRNGKSLSSDPTLANVDVATIKLKEDLVDRSPIPIYGGDPLAAGKLVALVGYGDTGLGAGVKRFAQSHVGRWIEDEEVLGSRFQNLLLLDSITGTGACPGDSGGGIFVKTTDGYRLVGVVDGVNDVLYPGFPVSTCDRCPQGIGVVTRLANHAGFLGI